jgi:hypothetical protein
MDTMYYRIEIHPLSEKKTTSVSTEWNWIIDSNKITQMQNLIIGESTQPLAATNNKWKLSDDLLFSYKVSDVLVEFISDYTELPLVIGKIILEFNNCRKMVEESFSTVSQLEKNISLTVIYDKSIKTYIEDEIKTTLSNNLTMKELDEECGFLEEMFIIEVTFTFKELHNSFGEYSFSSTHEPIPDKIEKAKVILFTINFTIICKGKSKKKYKFLSTNINSYTKNIQSKSSFITKIDPSHQFNTILIGGPQIATLGRALNLYSYEEWKFK